MNSAWANLIPPSGTLIAHKDPEGVGFLMSDGKEYTARRLHEDRRNVDGLAPSTFSNRLGNGERDIERIFQRKPRQMPKRRPSVASVREFARKGMAL